MNKIGLIAKNNLSFKNVQQEQTYEFQKPPAVDDLSGVEIPDIYKYSAEQYNKKTLKEKIKPYDFFNMIVPWLEHPLLMAGTCFGLSYGVDKFAHACGGEYEKSIVGKVAKLGDNIVESKFVQSKPVQAVWNAIVSGKNKITGFFKNSDLVNAIRKTPTQPELGMVKDEMLNMKQRVIHDFTRITDTLKLTSDEAVKLSDLRIGKKENEFIKAFFGGAEKNKETIANAIQLKRLGLEDDAIREILNKANATSIVKTKTLEKIGLTKEFLQKLAKEGASPEDIIKVKEACKKAPKIKIEVGRLGILGPFQPIARKIGFDQVGNRLISMTEAKTKLGRMFATLLQKCHRGFTFGGGKGGVLLLVSPFVVDAILNVKRAEPKEKVATAAHDGIHAISWVFTFPLGLKMMHHLAGAKYSGMSPEEVKQYRNLVSEFNKKVEGNIFSSHAEYKTALKELKTSLKALKGNKPQNLITSISKKLGSFLTMDLGVIKPYKNGNSIMNTVRKIPNILRNVGGVPMRLILWGGITMGLLDGTINKTIKFLFGNYHDGMKEKEHEDAKIAQKKFLKEDLMTRLKEAQKEKMLALGSVENNQEINSDYINPQDAKLVEAPEVADVQEEIKIVEIPQEINNAEQVKASADSEKMTPVQEKKSVVENQEKPEQVQIPVQEKKSVKENQEKLEQAPIPVQEVKTEAKAEEQKVNKDNYSYIPSSINVIKQPEENTSPRRYIPSSKNVIVPEENKNALNRKYIPSQEGAKIHKTFDNSGLEAALNRASRAEQQALQVLSGNFNNFSSF